MASSSKKKNKKKNKHHSRHVITTRVRQIHDLGRSRAPGACGHNWHLLYEMWLTEEKTEREKKLTKQAYLNN